MEIDVRGIPIGDDHPPIVVAELGINHDGKLDIAKSLALDAIKNGAKFIKNQTHIPEDEMSQEAKHVKPGNADVSIYEVISSRLMSEDEEFELKRFVEDRGAIYFSTPFSRMGVERLRRLDVPIIKIGSGEANNYPFVKLVTTLKKPVIMSTGMNSINSIKQSVEMFREANLPYALLHCTNLYPTKERLIRLESIRELKKAFPDAIVGLSDHSTSNYPCLGAVALGASILERHYTDTKDRSGPDIVCSMTGQELKELDYGSKLLFEARGGSKVPVKDEEVTSAFAFSSVVAISDISQGDILSENNIWVMRPSGGFFGPADYSSLIGQRAKVPAKKGYQLPKEIV